MIGSIQCDGVEGTRELAHTGALADRRGVRYRLAVVHVTDTRWVRQGIAMDSVGPQQHSYSVQLNIDGVRLGIEGRQRYYFCESSLGQAEIAGLVECSCQNVLAHRRGDWDRQDLAGFYYRADQHRKVTEGEAVVVAVDRCEEVVAEWWDDRANAVYGNLDAVFWVPDPIHPSL